MKTASEAVNKLPGLVEALNARRADIADCCEELGMCWDQLGRLGAQRDDHAAEYLKQLLPHVVGLKEFSTVCCQQLEQLIADPFGEKQEKKGGR